MKQTPTKPLNQIYIFKYSWAFTKPGICFSQSNFIFRRVMYYFCVKLVKYNECLVSIVATDGLVL